MMAGYEDGPPPGMFDDEPSTVVDIKTRKKPKPRAVAGQGQHEFDIGDHVEIGKFLNADLALGGHTTFSDGGFYRYNEDAGIYAELKDPYLNCLIQDYSGSPITSTGKRLAVRLADIKSGIVCAAKRADDPTFFDGAKQGVTFTSTFVEVKPDGVKQHQHAQEHRARFAYPFGYLPNAQPKQFLTFLEQVFRDDTDAAEKIALLQEHVGLSLIGSGCRYQRVVMLTGVLGSNGKSTTQAILRAAMPPGSVVSIAPHDMGEDYERACFPGARLNVVSEVEARELVNTEPWKAIVDGKNPIKARSLYKDVIFFTPIAGHLYSCNQLPDTTDHSGGFWRRWAVIPFNRTFTGAEVDPDIDQRILATELPALVSWLIQGAQRALERGSYALPPSSEAAVLAWRRIGDQVAAFVEDKCNVLEPEAGVHRWAPSAQLYKAYQLWAVENGHRIPLALRRFRERMELLKLVPVRRSEGVTYPVELKWSGE